MSEKMRLQRYLAVAGVAARRKAEELIVAGRVRVNGKQVRKLGTTVDPQSAHVTVDGEAVAPLDFFYVLFNKPKGCVAAVSDERGRPTIMEYLPNLPVPVRPVGRLDFYAEGVLLLTNDGELAARLVSPQRAIARTYHVKIRGELARPHLERLRTGVRLEDGSTTLPAEVDVLPAESRHAWLAVTLAESGERLVQDMLEALGYQVQKLQRVAYGTLSFHGLRVGDARELTQSELNALRDLVELDHRPVARGAWRSTREDTDLSRRARERQRAEAAEAAEAGASGQAVAPAPGREGREERPGARSGSERVRDDRRGAGPGRGERRGEGRGAGRGERRGASRATAAGRGEGPGRGARGEGPSPEASGRRGAGAAPGRGARPGMRAESGRARPPGGREPSRTGRPSSGRPQERTARPAGPAARTEAGRARPGSSRSRPAPKPSSRPSRGTSAPSGSRRSAPSGQRRSAPSGQRPRSKPTRR